MTGKITIAPEIEADVYVFRGDDGIVRAVELSVGEFGIFKIQMETKPILVEEHLYANEGTEAAPVWDYVVALSEFEDYSAARDYALKQYHHELRLGHYAEVMTVRESGAVIMVAQASEHVDLMKEALRGEFPE